MRAPLSFGLIVLLHSAAVPPGACSPLNSSLTVVLDYEQPHSPSSFEAMRTELRTIMKRVGFDLEVKDKQLLEPNAQFGGLVVFRMAGRCDSTPVPVGALSDERGPLAMAFASDGQILPFGEVRCDRIRRSLERTLGPSMRSERDRAAFGSALGKVVAHEIYHMLAHEANHTKGGLTKEALSSHELLDNRLSFSDKAIQELDRNTRVGPR